MTMSENATLPLSTRVWFAWVAFFRILFDGKFAAAVHRAPCDGSKVLAASEAEPSPTAAPKPAPALPPTPTHTPALQVLALLQREGRLIDFLQQDIATFSDADVGAAARVVHAGCRKALRAHATLTEIRQEEEGTAVTLAPGFSPAEIKLVGDVSGAGPFRGKVVHRGWKVSSFALPEAVEGHDPMILAPAEVEL